MKTVLVTGCNRGIGLGFIKQLIKRPNPPKHILATCRDTQKATELCEIASQNSNVHLLNIDMTQFNQYSNFAKKVEEIVKDDGLNVLINNAGVTTRFTRIQQVKLQQMMDNLVVNTVAPLMLTKELLPLLKKSAEKNSSRMGIERCAIVNMSSSLGSIEGNTEGGFFPYRSSKSALNAISKSLSVDLSKDGILVVSMHPGWCKTDMGGKNAPLDVDLAVTQMLDTLDKLDISDSGSFIQYDGSKLPW